MPGPTPMTLGGIAFQALGFSYNGLKRDLQTPWSALEVCGRMEALHWTGPKAESVTISGVLFPEDWGGLGTLESVRGAATSGSILPLITGDGDVLGNFVIEGVEEDRSAIDAQGQPRKNAYSI
jgi:phage protein U